MQEQQHRGIGGAGFAVEDFDAVCFDGEEADSGNDGIIHIFVLVDDAR
jgi:hypothetical protein